MTVDACTQQMTITVTATDDCGNDATENFTFTIVDTTPPVVTTPSNLSIEGCSTDDIITALGGSTLAYSETPISITLAQFQAEGGDVTEDCGTITIGYVDSQSGSCPITVTRQYTISDGCHTVVGQ